MKKAILASAMVGLFIIPAYSQLSLKLTGGWTYVAAGDLNKAFRSENDLFGLYAFSHSGWFPAFHGGSNFGAELLYRVNEHLGLGLGIGYFRKPSEFEVAFDYGNPTNQAFALSAAAIPITLNLHYSVRVGRSLNMFFTGGTGYYLTKFNFGFDMDWGAKDQYGFGYSYKSGSGGLGFQGGIGLEYQIDGRLSLSVEVLGRLAKISDFKGDWTRAITSQGTTTRDQGRNADFYFFEYLVDGTTYSDLFFGEGLPERAIHVRRGAIDLTGFSALVGIKYSFGKK